MIGLRDRKRRDTHARIQGEALRLFMTHGFEAVTLDQIAEAAGVSRRSLFHYFASKEEMALSAKVEIGPRLAQAVARRPADESLLDMAEAALTEMAQDFQGPEARALARLISTTPALEAGDHAKYAALETTLAAAMAERSGRAADDAEIVVVAAAAIAIMRHATDAWLAADDSRGPEVFGHALFAALRRAARG
ncbi:TetR/AcrR family transcriptional regulator [Brevundimonas balnearis]|uniref:TetR/AcrR family transcriptional regulator n=1 Tax=Brevundimonas balnearis TaxID=1572858 RepID=A0ABV6R5D4_9CAUL